MIDQFLANELKEGNLKVKIKARYSELLVHGHCHQKALYGTDPMKHILSQDENLSLSEVPSGCCGMAGSFGYEKEHYDISTSIGSEILMPAIKELKEDVGVVACGFSCRHQIDHHTGKKAKHWVEQIEIEPAD